MVDIVIAAHSHPAINYGGGEVAAHRQFEHMRSLGYDVAFVGACVSAEEAERFLGPNQFVAEIGENDFLIRSGGMHHFYLEQDSQDTENLLLDFLASFRASVYHFHHIWNIGVGVLRRLKARLPDTTMAYTLHEMLLICANHGQMVKTNSRALCSQASALKCTLCVPEFSTNDHDLRAYKLTKFLNSFDHLISPSQFVADRFKHWGVHNQISVIENGVPFEQSNGGKQIDSARLSRKFAFFGRGTPTKGLDVLIKAARIIELENSSSQQSQQYQLSTPPEQAQIKCEIDIFGTTQEAFEADWPGITVPSFVRFHGPYTPDQVIGFMQKQGRIIMPSIWWENSPVIIQEAKAAKRPMIMSDIGGMAEKGEGWSEFFDVGDANGLASKIMSLSGNVEQYEEAVDNVPEPYSMSAFMDEWCRLLQYELS